MSDQLDCGHEPDKGEPYNSKGDLGWRFVLLDDGRRVCHACADKVILDCGHTPSPHSHIATGYATTSDGKKICYACAADCDRAEMIATGKATLYLAHAPDAEFPNRRAWSVSNWPGSLKFAAHGVKVSRYGGGFGSQRTDAYFTGPDGKKWHAVNRGDMDIARCHRLAKQ